LLYFVPYRDKKVVGVFVRFFVRPTGKSMKTGDTNIKIVVIQVNMDY
jgi:hypothetical protein